MEEGHEGGQEVEAGLSEHPASAGGSSEDVPIEVGSSDDPLAPHGVGPGARLAGWAGLATVVALVHDRLWATPNLAFFTTIADHLGSNPFGGKVDGDYLLTNLSGPVVARALGQTAPHEYVRLHILLTIVGLGLVVFAAYRRFGYEVARLLVVLIAASPALTVVFEWLGQPDALTFPLALGVVVARRRWTAFALAVGLGLTHAEQGVVIALVATAARLAVLDGPELTTDRPDRPSWLRGQVVGDLLSLVGGVAVGRVVVEIYLRANDIVVSKPRTAYLDLGLSGFAEHHLKSHGVIVYALWGPLWLAIVVAALRFARSGRSWPTSLRRQWTIVGIAAIAAVVPMLATLDETRVYSLTTAPLLVAGAVLARRTVDRVPTARLTGITPPRSWIAIGVAAIVLAAAPAVFTAGEAYWSTSLPVGEFARFLRDGEHPGDLTGWLLHPFGFRVPTTR